MFQLANSPKVMGKSSALWNLDTHEEKYLIKILMKEPHEVQDVLEHYEIYHHVLPAASANDVAYLYLPLWPQTGLALGLFICHELLEEPVALAVATEISILTGRDIHIIYRKLPPPPEKTPRYCLPEIPKLGS